MRKVVRLLTKRFFHVQNVRTDCGVHLVARSMGTRVPSGGIQRPGCALIHSSPSHAQCYEREESLPPFPPTCLHDAYRNNLTYPALLTIWSCGIRRRVLTGNVNRRFGTACCL